MNHTATATRSSLVAIVAAALVLSISGSIIGQMLPVVDATEPKDGDDDDNTPHNAGTSVTNSYAEDIGNGIGTGSSGFSASDSSADQLTTTLATEEVVAGSTNPACGQEVSGLVDLTANLNCSGDGIIIGSPNTVINLNGFSITGPGQDSSKVAIMVSNVDNVVVNGPGSLDNFQAGVLLTGSNGFKMNSVILSNNEIGTFMTGAENSEIRQNIFQSNNIGIASHSSSAAAIDSNLMSGNLLAGITFVNTQQSNVGMNNIIGSQSGVFVDTQSSQNTITANNVHENVVDLNNGNGLPTNINANQYVDNSCETSNPSGLCIGK